MTPRHGIHPEKGATIGVYAREEEEEGSLKICPPDIKLSQKAEEGRREEVYAELRP